MGLPLYLAKADIRQRYRRSSLGPFWITISTGVMIACIGIIFGNLFKSPIKDFLPFLAAGLIIWSFISTVLIEATQVFITAEPIIRQLPIPIFSHVTRVVARNFIIFLHNIVIYPIVCLCVMRGFNFNVLLVIPGLALLIVNLLWMGLVIGIVCTRFRDMGQIVQSLLQIVFYVTPISGCLLCFRLVRLHDLGSEPLLSSFGDCTGSSYEHCPFGHELARLHWYRHRRLVLLHPLI